MNPITLLVYMLLGFAVPAFLLRVLMAPRRTQHMALGLGLIVLALLLPTLAFAAPWYEREPFVTPVGYLLGAVAVAAGAWLTGLFAKSKKADIANANQALADALDKQLQDLMTKAIHAVEERAAATHGYTSKNKRDEALVLFQQGLPKGISIPHNRALVMLDAALAASPFGASGKKKVA